MINNILKVISLLQIIACIFTPMEISLDYLIPLLMILLFVFLMFWLQIEPAIKYPKVMEKYVQANHEFGMHVFGLKTVNSQKDARLRMKIGTVAELILGGLALLGYIITYLTYVSQNFVCILNNFIKLTRLLGLVCFIVCTVSLILRIHKNKQQKNSVRYFVSRIGLLTQNVLFSMILFIY